MSSCRAVSLRLSLLVTGLALLLAPPALARGTRSPSHAQIQAAARRAERSPYLWATVNICNTQRYPDMIGIRGQMPGLGFSARMYMEIGVEYWSYQAKRFELVPGAQVSVALGSAATGVHQGGATFVFKPSSALLAGLVTFDWKLDGKTIARTGRLTSRGHDQADDSDPHGFSDFVCTIS